MRRLAYADPPYLGCSKLYDHPDAATWDDPDTHADLMHRMDQAYDGWALSLHVPSLPVLLPRAPSEVRIGAWVKPFAAFKRNVRIAYTWEPVLFRAPRERRPDDPVGRDHVAASITLKKGLTGAKPPEFCRWVLTLLAYQVGDEVDDLFPGTGVMGRVVSEGVQGRL